MLSFVFFVFCSGDSEILWREKFRSMPDGRVARVEHKLGFYEIELDGQKRSFLTGKKLHSGKISPDGKRVVFTYDEGQILCCDIPALITKADAHEGQCDLDGLDICLPSDVDAGGKHKGFCNTKVLRWLSNDEVVLAAYIYGESIIYKLKLALDQREFSLEPLCCIETCDPCRINRCMLRDDGSFIFEARHWQGFSRSFWVLQPPLHHAVERSQLALSRLRQVSLSFDKGDYALNVMKSVACVGNRVFFVTDIAVDGRYHERPEVFSYNIQTETVRRVLAIKGENILVIKASGGNFAVTTRKENRFRTRIYCGSLRHQHPLILENVSKVKFDSANPNRLLVWDDGPLHSGVYVIDDITISREQRPLEDPSKKH